MGKISDSSSLGTVPTHFHLRNVWIFVKARKSSWIYGGEHTAMNQI